MLFIAPVSTGTRAAASWSATCHASAPSPDDHAYAELAGQPQRRLEVGGLVRDHEQRQLPVEHRQQRLEVGAARAQLA
jgi:hypothetical protein